MITAVFKGADIDELERLREDFAAGASRRRSSTRRSRPCGRGTDYLAGPWPTRSSRRRPRRSRGSCTRPGRVHAALMGGGFRAARAVARGRPRRARAAAAGADLGLRVPGGPHVPRQRSRRAGARAGRAGTSPRRRRRWSVRGRSPTPTMSPTSSSSTPSRRTSCALRADTGSARALLDRVEQLSAGSSCRARRTRGLLARVRPAADRRRRRGPRHPRAPGSRSRGARLQALRGAVPAGPC